MIDINIVWAMTAYESKYLLLACVDYPDFIIYILHIYIIYINCENVRWFFNFGEKFTPKLKITQIFSYQKFWYTEACVINEN